MKADERTEGRAPARVVLTPRVLAYLRPYAPIFVLSLVQVFLLAGFELAKPWPLKFVVDSVLGDRPVAGLLGRLSATELLAIACFSIVAIQAAHAGLSYWNNRTTISIGQRLVNDLRSDLYGHLQRLSLSFHASRHVGDLLYRLIADTFAVQGLTMNGIYPIASALVFAVGMMIVLFRLDFGLAVMALGIGPILFVTIRSMSAQINVQSRIAREQESDVYTIVQHGLTAIRVVQAFTQEEAEHRRFLERSREALGANLRLYLAQTFYSGLVNTLTAAGTALVLWFGARRVLAGDLSVGEILVFLGYLASLYVPIANVSQSLGTIEGARAGLRRVFEILDEPGAVSGTRILERAAVRGEIRFENVSFSYDGSRPVLSSVDVRVPPGTSIALVGPTGAGKSTLAGLLPRFHDPSSGRVLLDGVDLRELELKSLRRSISMVLQPPLVFGATMRENIAYGRAGAAPAEIEKAAELARLGSLLERLPLGLDTVIGEGGATLSEGERQRLTIARALLRDAPILILDEPTASVDSETEAALMTGLRTLMRGRTTFLIAHRLSTVREVDQILVIRDGQVVESGSYQTLMAQKGFFTRLVELQSAAPESRSSVP